ncbi:MAG: DOMON-like domain-containing protein [Phormidesmis sp.]
MTELTTFTLVPFAPLPERIDLTVTGTSTREGTQLSLSYLMAGDLDAVVLPTLSSTHARQDRLWEQTCFEVFWALGAEKSDEDPYWELNFSPTGAWNVFALEGYRQGRTEAMDAADLPFTVSHSSEGLRLDVSVDLGALLSSEASDQLASAQLAPAQVQWRLGIGVVMVLGSGEETFWAIAHPGPTADFHRSDSFTLLLSP